VESGHPQIGLSMSVASNSVGQNHFKTKVNRTIAPRPALAEKMGATAAPVKIHDTETNEWADTAAITLEAGRTLNSFEMCARALYFHETGGRFPHPVNIVDAFTLDPHDLPLNESNNKLLGLTEKVLAGLARKGKNPEVFQYKYAEENGVVIILMEFYGGNNELATFPPPSTALNPQESGGTQ
jgi:hypothetical protein